MERGVWAVEGLQGDINARTRLRAQPDPATVKRRESRAP